MDGLKTKDGYAQMLDYLVKSIQGQAFAPGGRLPTERQLAEDFGVSRAAARRALAKLEADGLISRHVGRGTFVRLDQENGSDQMTPVAASKEMVSPAEFIESRLRFEPQLAWLVATNGTSVDFQQMGACLEEAEKAESTEEFEEWDERFHQAIAAATHNTLAIGMYDMILAVRREYAMWGTLKQRGQTPEHRLVYQQEHRQILDALQQRDAELACEIMFQHIRNTRRRLLDY